jgi:Na+/H+-dicarboxylate symporter/ABC-type amino acid transport substrate-binding protein
MSLSARVLLGLALGVVTGLFFGESVAFLEVPGRAFVVLLQMTVLPFVSVALIHSLGRLRTAEARTLARYAGLFLLVIWAVTLAVVVAFPLAFPGWEAASFFSSSLVEEPPPFDPLTLYLPSNPFQSFAEGVVPAVVVFSVAVGLSLMISERKQALLESLGTLEETLQRIAGFVVSLAPYGVFAIAGHAAGSMRVDELLDLQVYVAAYVLAALALAFWILPMLVTSLTPFRYGEVVGHAREALITAFATGSVFVVLPILAYRSKELLDTREGARESQGLVDVIVPIAFTLSSAGKLLALAFVLFAGWMSGFPLAATQIPQFLISGLFSFFASTAMAVPFLLDLFRIPSDTFQLFLVADNVVGNRFGSLTASVHILTLTLLGACGAAGLLKVRRVRLVRWGVVAGLLVLGGFGGLRLAFESIDRPYAGYQAFIERSLVLPRAPAKERQSAAARASGSALDRIRESGVVRVGWTRDRLPLVFRNQAGELVGFDVEMAHALARDLGVSVEFVQVDPRRAPELLDSGAVDLLMSGFAITPERMQRVAFSDPYLEETLCFIVSDHRRDDFTSRDAVQAHPTLRLAIPANHYYAEKVRSYLPQAELVEVASPREFFSRGHPEVDGLVFSAESGSAWTLIYPQFTVAVPHPDLLKVPLGYAVRRGDPDTVEFLNQWILLKQRDLTIPGLFAYWFQGVKPPEARQRRWSILHDVILGDDRGRS